MIEDPDPDNPEAACTFSAQQDPCWHYSIARMVDASTNTVLLPFYGPYGDIKDVEGCETQFRACLPSGLRRRLVTAPGADRYREEGLLPDPKEEVKFAKKVIEAIPDGRGVRMIDGKIQQNATWKQCKVMVDLAEMLARKDPELAEAYEMGSQAAA